MELLTSYDSVNELKRFLDKNNFAMKKRFGQNFLVSPGGRRKILNVLGDHEGNSIWEIGPGLGALTHILLQKAKSLTVFEIDHGFIRYLLKAFGDDPRFCVVRGDVIKTWKEYSKKNHAPDKIIGNLPYSSASAIIASFIEHDLKAEKMVFTVQKEMGDRIAAVPGTKNYSSFSMLCQFKYTVFDRGDLKPGAFYPAPEVISKIVEMRPHRLYIEVNETLFFKFINDLFISRRKKIKNNLLKGRLSHEFSGDSITAALKYALIDPDDRGENIDVSQAVKAVLFLQRTL